MIFYLCLFFFFCQQMPQKDPHLNENELIRLTSIAFISKALIPLCLRAQWATLLDSAKCYFSFYVVHRICSFCDLVPHTSSRHLKHPLVSSLPLKTVRKIRRVYSRLLKTTFSVGPPNAIFRLCLDMCLLINFQ